MRSSEALSPVVASEPPAGKAPAVPSPSSTTATVRGVHPALLIAAAISPLLAVVARLTTDHSAHVADTFLSIAVVLSLTALVLIARSWRSTLGPAGLPRERLDNLEDRIETLADAKWQLSEQERGYRDLLDAQEDVIARRNAQGRITFVNRAFCRTFGATSNAVLETDYWPSVLATDTRDAADGQQFELIQTAAGSRWFVWSEHGVPGPGGRGGETQIVGRDVTRERQHAATLAEARDEAEAANRAKSRFLAAMSHEIRTPMNGILGMADLLRETALMPEQQSYIEAIDQSAQTLLKLIDEILDFSKIEAGRLALRNEPFDIETTVQSVVELMAPAAHEKYLEIAWTIEPDVPRRVVGDEMRVRQILLNLVSNAVKFTERGGVQVAVTSAQAPDVTDRITVSMEVMDTGIGLPASAVDTLFAEFERMDHRLTNSAGGTGLGLAISRRLARAMGGDITLDSRPGLGSTFTATVALGPPGDAVTAPVPDPGRLAGRRVLLAFAQLIERRALASMLRHAGATVIETSDVRAAVEIEIARRVNTSFDMMVVDADDSLDDAAAGLADARSLPDGATTSGMVLVDACKRRALAPFRAEGFCGYLLRPVRPRTIEARFSPPRATAAAAPATAQAPSSLSASATPTAPQPLRRAHVLLAEDNLINARLAKIMLAHCGCTVQIVGDGAEAARLIEASLDGSGTRFDLVLMDMHMPIMDGLTATRQLKAAASAAPAGSRRLPPIVAVTANAFAEDRAACLGAGMDDYIPKPFTRADIEGVLERWVGRVE